jgi:hypothetical protein
MDIRLFGIDCAVEDPNVGVACSRLNATGVVFREAIQCTGERKAINTIVNWIE